MSSNTEASSDSSEQEPERNIDVTWQANAEEWEVVSEADGGFDRIIRPDYMSARHAADVHERATGNFAQVNLLRRY